MMEGGRIGRFVRAARKLLLLQLAAAVLATAFAVWAVVGVRDLAAERDRLREQVAALQSQQTGTAEFLPAETPGSASVTPPLVLPIAIPVDDSLADTNTLLPEPALPPEANVAAPPAPGAQPTPELDCAGADSADPRCRPVRWRVPLQRRPAEPPPDAEPKNEQEPAPGS